MSENTTTQPDWIAAKRVAQDSIKMFKLILKAVNHAKKKQQRRTKAISRARKK